MSRAIRYLVDKLVDQIVGILLVIILTALIAGIPLVVLPTMSTGFVLLTVAFAAFVGILLKVFILPRLRKKATHDLVEMIQSVRDNEEMWFLGYDHDTWAKHLSPAIKSCAKDRNATFTFLFFYPRSKIFRQAIASELMEEGAQKTAEGSADNLRDLRRTLGEDKIQIRFCDLPPAYSMVIINPNAEVGAVAHVWPHMYTMLYPDRLWLTYARDTAAERTAFEKCKASYKYALGKSWEDGQPTPQFVESVEVTEKEPIPQIMKTFDRGYDPDRAAKLDPNLAGVHVLFFWPKKYSWEKGERNPNMNMPYSKVIIKDKEAFWWGAYAEDLFRKGKIDYNNAPGDFENEDEMLVYLRKNGYNLHPQPISPKDLLGEPVSQ